MKKYLGLLLGIVVSVAAFAFVYKGELEDVPPVISWNGQLIQGMLESGKQGFLEYEESDVNDYDDFKDDYEDEHDNADAITLHAGVNYVSPLEDISVEDLTKCIDPEADRVLFAQYDADEGEFLTYPKGPFGDDTQEIEDTDYKFEAGKGFVIISRKAADAYCVAAAEDKAKVTTTDPMDEDVRGWVLLHSSEGNVEDLVASFEDRVDKVWMMIDENEFEKVDESDYDEDLDDFYMVWVKLSKGENGADNAAVSAVGSFVPTRPVVVFDQVDDNHSQIIFSWDKVADANARVENYLVEVYNCNLDGTNCDHTGYYAEPHRVNSNSTVFYFYNPSAGKEYHFKVAAKLQGREVAPQDYTAEVSVDVAVAAAAVVANDVEVEVDVEVEEEPSANVPARVDEIVVFDEPSFGDDLGIPNNGGNFDFGGGIIPPNGGLGEAIAILAPPVGFSVEGYNGNVDLSWQAPVGMEPDQFKVMYWKPDQSAEEGKSKFVDFVPGQSNYNVNINETLVNSATDGTRYLFAVQSMDEAGNKSDPVGLSERIWILPAAVVQAEKDPGDESQIRYTWSAPSLVNFDYLEVDKYFVDIYLSGEVQVRVFLRSKPNGAWEKEVYSGGVSIQKRFYERWPAYFYYQYNDLPNLDTELRLYTQYKFKDGSDDFLVSAPSVKEVPGL